MERCENNDPGLPSEWDYVLIRIQWMEWTETERKGEWEKDACDVILIMNTLTDSCTM